jgi:hypothetical protein
MQLQLSSDQVELLREVLDRAFRDLRSEVVATDPSDFKHELRDREAMLSGILQMVGGPLPNRR